MSPLLYLVSAATSRQGGLLGAGESPGVLTSSMSVPSLHWSWDTRTSAHAGPGPCSGRTWGSQGSCCHTAPSVDFTCRDCYSASGFLVRSLECAKAGSLPAGSLPDGGAVVRPGVLPDTCWCVVPVVSPPRWVGSPPAVGVLHTPEPLTPSLTSSPQGQPHWTAAWLGAVSLPGSVPRGTCCLDHGNIVGLERDGLERVFRR